MNGSVLRRMIVVLVLLALLGGCGAYERKIVPFKMPAAYPNTIEVAGVVMAARAIAEPEEAKVAFGFDIIDAGVMPIQVVFDNQGKNTFSVVPDQTFLIDADNNLWPIIDSGLAHDRINRKTQLGKVVPEALRSGALTGAAGAIIGAAIGIVTGTSVAEAAGKGAAIGAALGLTVGGARGIDDPTVRANIQEDLKKRSLQNRPIKPGDVAFGFIFFPGETNKPKQLRLRLRQDGTGQIFNLTLIL